LEATAISKIEGGAGPADGWSVRHQKCETPEVTALLLEIRTNNILNEIDRRALVSSEATRLIEGQAHLVVKISDATPLKIRELAIAIPDRRRVSRKKRSRRESRLVIRISALVSVFGLGWIIGSNLYFPPQFIVIVLGALADSYEQLELREIYSRSAGSRCV
jgi:hypothetical protein